LNPIVRDRLQDLLQSLLSYRAINGQWQLLDHERIASLVCALTGLCVVCRQFVVVGAAPDGYIALPPPWCWGKADAGQQAWAWFELTRHLAAVKRLFPRRRGVPPA